MNFFLIFLPKNSKELDFMYAGPSKLNLRDPFLKYKI